MHWIEVFTSRPVPGHQNLSVSGPRRPFLLPDSPSLCFLPEEAPECPLSRPGLLNPKPSLIGILSSAAPKIQPHALLIPDAHYLPSPSISAYPSDTTSGAAWLRGLGVAFRPSTVPLPEPAFRLECLTQRPHGLDYRVLLQATLFP